MNRPTCDGCDQPTDAATLRHYEITCHDGTEGGVRYCADCAEGAAFDRNGNTAWIRPLTEVVSILREVGTHEDEAAIETASRVIRREACEHCDRPVWYDRSVPAWFHTDPALTCFLAFGKNPPAGVRFYSMSDHETIEEEAARLTGCRA